MKITKNNLVQELQAKNAKALDFLIDEYDNLLYKVIYNVLHMYGEKGVIDDLSSCRQVNL